METFFNDNLLGLDDEQCKAKVDILNYTTGHHPQQFLRPGKMSALLYPKSQ